MTGRGGGGEWRRSAWIALSASNVRMAVLALSEPPKHDAGDGMVKSDTDDSTDRRQPHVGVVRNGDRTADEVDEFVDEALRGTVEASEVLGFHLADLVGDG